MRPPAPPAGTRRPALVASDFDGTLLRSDATVSDRSRAALTLVKDSGAHLVIVTGRPARWMTVAAEQAGHGGIAVISNGAAVFDLATETVIRTDPIAPADAAEMVELITAAVPDCVIAGERLDGLLRERAYVTPLGDSPQVRVTSRAEVVEEPLLKLLVRTSSHDADGLLAAASAVVGAHLGTITHSSREGLIEISAAGVTKASALERMAAELGIQARDAVAFGDMPNDIPMLRWAGRSWAVANAHPQARAAADAVTKSNDEDGVAVVLEELFG